MALTFAGWSPSTLRFHNYHHLQKHKQRHIKLPQLLLLLLVHLLHVIKLYS